MVTYLAATAGELQGDGLADHKIAYMACHFSLYTTGLSNVPDSLPTGSMLILNDQIPICGHDPYQIKEQLEQAIERLSCDSLLLDFQRPGNSETAKLCAILAKELSCPLGVSHHYARDLNCCVFLPPPPLDMPLAEYLNSWEGRNIWLEAALETAEYVITADGCKVSPLPYEPPQEKTFLEETLHCRYRCRVAPNEIRFFLYRTQDQLDALLEQTEALGIEKTIGLYQQLGMKKPLVD